MRARDDGLVAILVLKLSRSHLKHFFFHCKSSVYFRYCCNSKFHSFEAYVSDNPSFLARLEFKVLSFEKTTFIIITLAGIVTYFAGYNEQISGLKHILARRIWNCLLPPAIV